MQPNKPMEQDSNNNRYLGSTQNLSSSEMMQGKDDEGSHELSVIPIVGILSSNNAVQEFSSRPHSSICIAGVHSRLYDYVLVIGLR